ncbi:MAG: hypothetical protein V1494_04025 [Candidatus Diapherotrites archaeon]
MLEKLISRTEALIAAFRENNVIDLKHLANDCIEDAAMQNDELFAQLSLIAYSLNKLSSKDHIVRNAKWGSAKNAILGLLEKCIAFLKAKKIREFKAELQGVSDKVRGIDETLGHYVENVFDKARVKQASTAYAFGLSLSSAAGLTGADKKELLNYIGTTKIHDEQEEGAGIESRLKVLRQIFQH